jgi:predicted ATPase
MITSLTVSNYRSIGESVELPFRPLTVLVGANGSGKSNLVDALRFVSDALSNGLAAAITHRHGIRTLRRWDGGDPFHLAIELKLHLGSGPARYSLELTGDHPDEYRVKSEEAEVVRDAERFSFRVEAGKWAQGPVGLQPPLDPRNLALQLVGGDVRFQPLVQVLRRIAIYSIFPDTLRAPQKYDPNKPMDRHGSNWTSILKDQPQDSWKPDLVEVLHQLTGDIEDVRLRPAADFLVAEFRHASPTRRQKWFTTAQESDGTLRIAGIATALLQQPALPLLGVEEPELTIHPGAIPVLFDYLKEASERGQVIVTTHSPELLDLVDADEVRVVSRRNGSTVVNRMLESQREAVREGLLTLGEMLRAEGLQPESPGVAER